MCASDYPVDWHEVLAQVRPGQPLWSTLIGVVRGVTTCFALAELTDSGVPLWSVFAGTLSEPVALAADKVFRFPDDFHVLRQGRENSLDEAKLAATTYLQAYCLSSGVTPPEPSACSAQRNPHE